MTALPFPDPLDHLTSELARLDLRLHRHIRRLRAAHRLSDDPYRGLYIPDEHVDTLLAAPPTSPIPTTDFEPTGSASLSRELAALEAQLAARRTASRDAGIELPLLTLRDRLGLDDFETDALFIALAPELDLKYETLFAYAQNDATRRLPTVDLVLKLACPTFESHLHHRRALAPDARLLGEPVLRCVADAQERDPPWLSQMLKVEPHIVDFLLGEYRLDRRLSTCARPVNHPVPIAALETPGPERAAALQHLASSDPDDGALLILEGPRGSGRQAAAAALCHAWRRPLLAVDLTLALADELASPLLLTLLRREARLTRGALLFHNTARFHESDAAAPRDRAAFLHLLDTANFPVFLVTESPWPTDPGQAPVRTPWHLHFEALEPERRHQLWLRALAPHPEAAFTNGELLPLAERFALAPEQIKTAARSACLTARLRPPPDRAVRLDDLQRAAAQQSGQALRRFGRKVPPLYAWQDLVLPLRTQQQLREICLAVKHRTLVHERWGFGRRLALGRSLNALFAGPSGTGKTMAAQVLARELGLDLFQIDLAHVVSKYIGETEKHLDAIFRAAQSSNAILFFDEADALFGKRTEVKDAHDRYANLEVAYLLQKMEAYEGIVILATNLAKNIDDAFRRRLQHSLEFPFPEPDLRERIWRGAFPPEAPLAPDVDFPFLARQFELAGGNIRNITLAAAVFAAEDHTATHTPAASAPPAITMQHVIAATARELQKMGKLPTRSEFGPHFDCLRDRP